MGLEAVILDRASPVPLFFQLSEQIRVLIQDGQLSPGSFFAGEVELASLWEVSRPTVRRAIDELVQAGLVQRRRGLGTMVVRPEIRRSSRLSSLYDDLARLNRKPTTTLISMTRLRASDEIAHEMNLAEGSEIFSVRRVRYVDGTGLALLHNYIPYDLLKDVQQTELENTGLYAIFRERGCFPSRATQLVGARLAMRQEAHHLGINEGAPVLTAQRTTFDTNNRVVDLGKHVYDASHYLFEMNISADEGAK